MTSWNIRDKMHRRWRAERRCHGHEVSFAERRCQRHDVSHGEAHKGD